MEIIGLVIAICVVPVAAIKLLTFAWHRVPRLLVVHASLKLDGLGRRIGLLRGMTELALPVRLTGVGGPPDRLDLSLIDRSPDLDLGGGYTVGMLAPLRHTRSYLFAHPAFLQIWVRSWLSYRLVAQFAWGDLRDVCFIAHDPDRLGNFEKVFRGSVGTIEVSVTPQVRLFLLIRVRPDPPIEKFNESR